jgi:regulator of protease activity HflC (stomatin/prohibitin superfamily)
MARLLIGLGLVVAFALTQTAFTIGEREQGLIIQLGNPKRILQEPGLYFIACRISS